MSKERGVVAVLITFNMKIVQVEDNKSDASSERTVTEEMVWLGDMATHGEEPEVWSVKKRNKTEDMDVLPSSKKRKDRDGDGGEDSGERRIQIMRKKKENPNTLTCEFVNFIVSELQDERKMMKMGHPSQAPQTFAKFSKIVSEKWRRMSGVEKASYEDHEEVGGKRKVKKVKKVKDPNAPRRALSAFMLFQIDERKKLKTNPDHVNKNFGEMGKLLGERWNSMSSAEKLPWETATKLDQERYKKDLAEYNAAQASPTLRQVNNKLDQEQYKKDLAE